MSKVFYIGRFTPATGGVTAKNTAIYNEIIKETDVKKMDLTELKKGKITMLFSLVAALFGRSNTLIIGTTAKARRLFSMLLYRFNRKAMARSLLIVMGAAFGEIVSDDPKYIKWVSGYKAVFVETELMKKQLEAVGLNNTYIFENCRKKPKTEIKIKPRSGEFKCVCFSMIYPEKGIDTVLLAAQQLPEATFDFWGGINEDYKTEFLSTAEKLPNCKYRGVFKVEGDNVYHMLNGYDVLLFPTRCPREGVPGTVIEAKIAALPVISSDFSKGNIVVNDGIDAIVLDETNSETLVEAIKLLQSDDALLTKLKQGAKESGKHYYFENRIGEIISHLK